jgi:hypothetical protein
VILEAPPVRSDESQGSAGQTADPERTGRDHIKIGGAL